MVGRNPSPTLGGEGVAARGVVGRKRGGDGVPPFSTGGMSLTPPLFGLKFVQTLVHCCKLQLVTY